MGGGQVGGLLHVAQSAAANTPFLVLGKFLNRHYFVA
jgi:hypothetical protein